MPENHDHSNGAGSTGWNRDQDQGPSDNAQAEPQWPAADTPPAESAAEQTGKIEMPPEQGEAQPPRAPEPDAEQTQQIAALPDDFHGFPLGTTQSIPTVGSEQPTTGFGPVGGGVAGSGLGWSAAEQPVTPAEAKRQQLLKGGLIAGIAAAALVLLYIGDLVFTSGSLPRGTLVAGVDVGTMSNREAESKLRNELGADMQGPVELQVGEASTTIQPDRVGLETDWEATVAKADDQPLNPFTRIGSFFSTHEVEPVSTADRGKLVQALEDARVQLDRPSVEGTIRFDGTTPVAVDPVHGQKLDVQRAADKIMAHYAEGSTIELPASQKPVGTTEQGVQRALEEIAKPAVSGPVTVRGDGTDATLSPKDIADALRFAPNGKGGLRASFDEPTVIGEIEPQLADTIKPGKDAEIVLEGGRPTVHPSEDGRGIDWKKSLEPLMQTLRQQDGREIKAIYHPQPAQFTTEQANQLGVREVVGQFTTGGFEQASGVNIRRVAEQVNGALIRPGEQFSLNGYTGPRGKPQGYVESGIIKDGRPDKAVGGGISQFATTLYNASYFAGMKDIEHKAHSYYISRYPEGREATVFQAPNGKSIIDVKFKNVSDSGIMITTQWTPSDITVTLWGTKQFDVQSKTGPRFDPTPPEEKVVPPGEPCEPSKGKPGFSVVNTRTVRDLKTGQVRTEDQKTVYDPHPIIHCGAPPPPGPR
ncbi:VanW family protein [Saccharopolyspora halophila]|uniref:VanW family protein n=1 Tax=Saccharopolyspora halophila TaxID=405551 RepID=A0ABN3FQ53_9PSEU